MKKIILLSVVLCLSSLTAVFSQVINPIPSYNFPMVEPTAYFGEIRTPLSNSREKREMVVEISTASHFAPAIFAKVWVVKKNGNIVKGPYTIYRDQPLYVDIDHGKWGVKVQCDWEVLVDVWTTN